MGPCSLHWRCKFWPILLKFSPEVPEGCRPWLVIDLGALPIDDVISSIKKCPNSPKFHYFSQRAWLHAIKPLSLKFQRQESLFPRSISVWFEDCRLRFLSLVFGHTFQNWNIFKKQNCTTFKIGCWFGTFLYSYSKIK